MGLTPTPFSKMLIIARWVWWGIPKQTYEIVGEANCHNNTKNDKNAYSGVRMAEHITRTVFPV